MVALKDLSIRGDFRTTVEYLVTLLETDTFQNNDVDTGWLDRLISERVQAERPNTMLGIICACLQIALTKITAAFQVFQVGISPYLSFDLLTWFGAFPELFGTWAGVAG